MQVNIDLNLPPQVQSQVHRYKSQVHQVKPAAIQTSPDHLAFLRHGRPFPVRMVAIHMYIYK